MHSLNDPRWENIQQELHQRNEFVNSIEIQAEICQRMTNRATLLDYYDCLYLLQKHGSIENMRYVEHCDTVNLETVTEIQNFFKQ